MQSLTPILTLTPMQSRPRTPAPARPRRAGAGLCLGLAFLLALAGGPLRADLVRVSSESEFRAAVAGKVLTRPLIRLQVLPGGEIRGTGAARPVAGRWQWRDGYFCRDLRWGDRALGFNCQEVRLGAGRIRFTSDRGAGDFADFRLQR